MEVPEHVDGRAVDEHGLVAPEVPAQAARVHGALAVDADPELLLPGPAGGGAAAAHGDLVLRRALGEPDPRGVHHGARHRSRCRRRRHNDAVGPGDREDGARPGDLALELSLDELRRQVAHGQHHLGAGHGDDVEPGDRLRGRGRAVVPGGGEVPEERERGAVSGGGGGRGEAAGALAAAELDGGGRRGGAREGERRRGPVRGARRPGEPQEQRRRRRRLRGGPVGDGDGERGRRRWRRGGGGGGGDGERGRRGGAGDADGAVGDA